MKIVRSGEAKWEERINRGRFQSERKELGGSARLSAGLWRLPPGKTSFPFHAHLVTEEALFVVEGHAKLRTPEGLVPIGPGDYVSFPPGGPAHQLVNDGSEPLVYLALSASIGADVVTYPDSGKVAAVAGTYPSARRFLFKEATQVDYFDGED